MGVSWLEKSCLLPTDTCVINVFIIIFLVGLFCMYVRIYVCMRMSARISASDVYLLPWGLCCNAPLRMWTWGSHRNETAHLLSAPEDGALQSQKLAVLCVQHWVVLLTHPSYYSPKPLPGIVPRGTRLAHGLKAQLKSKHCGTVAVVNHIFQQLLKCCPVIIVHFGRNSWHTIFS